MIREYLFGMRRPKGGTVTRFGRPSCTGSTGAGSFITPPMTDETRTIGCGSWNPKRPILKGPIAAAVRSRPTDGPSMEPFLIWTGVVDFLSGPVGQEVKTGGRTFTSPQ